MFLIEIENWPIKTLQTTPSFPFVSNISSVYLLYSFKYCCLFPSREGFAQLVHTSDPISTLQCGDDLVSLLAFSPTRCFPWSSSSSSKSACSALMSAANKTAKRCGSRTCRHSRTARSTAHWRDTTSYSLCSTPLGIHPSSCSPHSSSILSPFLMPRLVTTEPSISTNASDISLWNACEMLRNCTFASLLLVTRRSVARLLVIHTTPSLSIHAYIRLNLSEDFAEERCLYFSEPRRVSPKRPQSGSETRFLLVFYYNFCWECLVFGSRGKRPSKALVWLSWPPIYHWCTQASWGLTILLSPEPPGRLSFVHLRVIKFFSALHRGKQWICVTHLWSSEIPPEPLWKI